MTESHYEERPPSPELTSFVESLWHQQIAPGGTPYSQRVLPDGCVDGLWRDGVLCVAGPATRWRMETVPAGSDIVGIRFRPGAARLLFGEVRANEACDQQIDLGELWGTQVVRELAERMGDAESPWAMAEIFQQAILARLPNADDVDPLVRAAIEILGSPQPYSVVSVSSVADRFGLSERQMRRRFVAAVGYGPKALEGVLRLRRVIRLYEQPTAGGGRLRMADVAMAAGYSDQPHMTREMRRLTGLTPGEFVAGR
jgi:AraC-like DNA-binding protein